VSEAAGAAAFGVASSDSLLSSLLAPLITAAGGAGPFGIAVGLAVAAVFEILDLFGFDLFGGGSAPVIPPGYYRPAHYVSSQFIGCSDVTPNMEDSPSSEATVVEVRLIFPNIPEDPTESFHPGEGWESRPNGNWSNPGPPQQGLHPDPGHEYPKGPHYDWNFRRPKRKFSIRNKGGNIQFWDEDLQQWLEALPEEIPPELIIP
jgi:hypothetical protein